MTVLSPKGRLERFPLSFKVSNSYSNIYKMYYFYEYDKTFGAPFAWFIAENRSKYEVATMFQRNMISVQNIKKMGNQLLVCFVNVDEYYLKLDEPYFLFTIRSDTNPGNMHIKLVFESHRYVNNMWRMPTEKIHHNTWNAIMQSEYSKCSEVSDCPEEVAEFGSEPIVEVDNYVVVDPDDTYEVNDQDDHIEDI